MKTEINKIAGGMAGGAPQNMEGAMKQANRAYRMLSNSALIFLLPAFTFWAVIGLFVRRKSKTFRLLVNIAVTGVVTVFFSSLLISAINASTVGTLVGRQQSQDVVSGMALVAFFSCTVGALITYLWLLRSAEKS